MIYERVGDTVYARFPNRPDIPRWVVSEKPRSGDQLTPSDWSAIIKLSTTNPALKKALDNLTLIYNMVKDGK